MYKSYVFLRLTSHDAESEMKAFWIFRMGFPGGGLQSKREGRRENQNKNVFSCCPWLMNSNPSGPSEEFVKDISESSFSGIRSRFIHWLLTVIDQVWPHGHTSSLCIGFPWMSLGNEKHLQAGNKNLWEAFTSYIRAYRYLLLW